MTSNIETPTAVVPIELLLNLREYIGEEELHGDKVRTEKAIVLLDSLEKTIDNCQWSKDA